ncbi:hypothetical protein BOH72_23400 [Mycobacterium sp. WY10]|nr:hypothetical protein BOH72_23400 [Mycobacterium sp. WY10]
MCVGEVDGDHSAVWRIWANRGTSDVYVAVRDISGYQKFSLHESGDWRHQFVTREQAQAVAQTTNRILDQWRQPAEHEQSRLTLGYTIRARSQDLASYPENKGFSKDLVWVPASPDDRVAVIHVAIARAQDAAVQMEGMVPIGGFTLADGRAVLVFYSLQVASAETHAQIDAVKQQITEQWSGVTPAPSAPRIAIHGNNEHGRFSWDIAIRLPVDGAEVPSSDG